VQEITDLHAYLNNGIHEWCGVQVQDLNQIKQKNGAGEGYDGILIFNPFDKKVFMVKNGIWDKYKEINGPCSELGIPKDTNGSVTEKNAEGYSDTSIKQAAYQRFETKKFNKNSIYWYRWQENCGWGGSGCKERSATYVVQKDVANKYESMGGAGSYLGFPKNDAEYMKSNCGTEGYHQEFGKGKIYSSKLGSFDMAYGEWMNAYWNAGENLLGWPTSEYRKDIEWTFEAGRVYIVYTFLWVYEIRSEEYGCGGDVRYIHDSQYDAEILLVNFANPDKVCFKSHIGMSNKVGETSSNGSLLRNYVASGFSDLVADRNSNMNGNRPVAAFNTDFIDGNNAPLDINFIQGNNYSGGRRWTSLAIGKNNEMRLITTIGNDEYNVSGGGPRFYNDGNFDDPCGRLELRGCYDKRRTIVGITNNNYMIVVVTSSLDTNRFDDILIKYSNLVGGNVQQGNMFDGGGSPSLAFDENNDGIFNDNDIKRQGGNSLSAALLIFKGDTCKYR
jgi:hypothetical protein